MAESPATYLSEAELDFLVGQTTELVDFARRSPHPDGGFAWLDDDGAPLLDLPVELWITCRMIHVLALAEILGDESCRPLVADGLELAAFGFAREDLEGRTLGEAFPPELAAELEPRYRAALNGEQVSWERAVGRRLFHLTASPVPALDGSVPSAMVLATDITESRRSERTWAALHEIATEVARSDDGPQQIAKRIADALCSVFEVDTAAVLKFAAADRAAVLAMSPQHLPGLPQDLVFAPGDKSAVALVATTGRPAKVTYEAIDGTVSGQLSKEGLRVGAAAPIFSHGELWGAIALGSRLPDGLDNAVLDRLSRFAELVELAIGQSESRAALEHEATTDDLTGLPNRRAFSDFLDREVELVKRRGWSLSVAIMDLDDFKRVNDTFGHPVGDQVLVELANRLIRASREGELIARLGGEEFGWVLPGADGDEAFRAAERVRQVVADSPFDVVGDLTTSIGVSSVGEDYDRESLLKRADLALYAAKAEGRNRTTRRQPG